MALGVCRSVSWRRSASRIWVFGAAPIASSHAVSGAVVRHGGYVANFLGDGIIAYFGWPHADEDNAAQAVRAGLDAVIAVRELSLQAHAGIASGPVVVGDLEAAGRRQTGAVAGETPNLAARLEALAGPDQVVIDGLTRQLIGAAFALEEAGLQTLKGFVAPVQAWRVVGERAVESRFEARARRLTPFVGREQEMALLLERFERAAAGEGQAVLLAGEAGKIFLKLRIKIRSWSTVKSNDRVELRS